jgi:MSHA biogenesis protein MshI
VERTPGQRPRLIWTDSAAWADPKAALKRLRPRLKGQRRVVLLQRQQYQWLPMEAPDVPRADWAQATRWRLKDLVDFAPEQASVDVLELPGDPQQHRQPQLVAVAAPHEGLRPLATAADDAGLPWTALDVGETALRNISALVAPEGRAQALLHLGDTDGLLVITHGTDLLMARQLDTPAAALVSEDSEQRSIAFDRIGLELQRTLDGFDRTVGHVALARLLVAPAPGAQALMGHVSELLYVPVELLDLGKALDLSAVPALANPAALNHHLRAIGAALREDA